ncbi:UNVERIFIED_CONTAM: hypothetical protein FKN15_003916 [Acipenser sinensis]
MLGSLEPVSPGCPLTYLDACSLFSMMEAVLTQTQSLAVSLKGLFLGLLSLTSTCFPLGHLIRQHSLMFHSYADDTQLYLKLDPGSPSAMVQLSACIQDIEVWMSVNFLQLNTNKSELLLVGSKTQLKNLNIGIPSGASCKGAPHGVQDVPYSLEIAGSNPGYVTADHDREFLGGGAQLAERCPGREGLGRQWNPLLISDPCGR